MNYTSEVVKNIYQISIPQLYGYPSTAHYLIKGEKTVLVEAAFPMALDYLDKALLEAGVRLEDIDYILVTHFHADHTSGIGALLKKNDKAKVLIHYRLYKVITDAARLLRGSRTSFGVMATKIFGGLDKISSVPIDRIIRLYGNEEIDIGKSIKIRSIYTPGHEVDHISFYEYSTKTLFPGEAVCMYNSRELRAFVPPCSGGVYEIDQVRESHKSLSKLDIQNICLPHFGFVEDIPPNSFIAESLRHVNYWYEEILGMLRNGFSFYQILNNCTQKILEMAGYKSRDQLNEYFRKYWFEYMPRLMTIGYMTYILWKIW